MKNRILIFLLSLITATACVEQGMGPIEKDQKAPSPVTNVLVENLPGGAKISYTLPDNPNLLYVKADFNIGGQPQEVKSSYYNNNLIVEGFGDTKEYEVTLYAVSRSEVASPGVKTVVKPLPAAMYDAFSSLVVKESFGGFNTWFENPGKGNIVIGVIRLDTIANEWVEVDNYYTGLQSGVFSVRGQQPISSIYGFFVRDRWNNRTDTLKLRLTPIYEEELDTKLFKDLRSAGNPIPQLPPLPASGQPIVHPTNLSSWPWTRLFDNLTGNTGFHTTEKKDVPFWLPIDLGKEVLLSRYKFWQRMHDNNSTYFYSHGNPHEWEIWGTNTPNDVNSWILLDHQVQVKPSGLPIGQVSNDDVSLARDGHEYEFPVGTKPVRYIAWKHIDSWAAIEGTTGFMHMGELKIWGQYTNK